MEFINSVEEKIDSSAAYERPTVEIHPIPYHSYKRMMDILVSAVALVLFSPIFLLVAIAIKITSRGPLLFKQTRVGLGGRHFTCLKFRSMIVDADEMKAKLEHLNEATGPVFKIKNDPRMTSIGKFIRKASLDELPQLWNVFVGDMSIVGPRPAVPNEVEKYKQREFGRLAVRPGITCIWQISGRSDLSFDEWMQLDLKYIENMSFWGDIKIVWQTVPAVLTGRGAR